MTENEAIKNVTAYIYMECDNMPQQVIKALDIMKDATEEIQQYRAIGTVEEFKALKEKAEPKKDNNDGGRCKACGTYNNFIINKLANPKGHPVIYCWNCGQAIDWT